MEDKYVNNPVYDPKLSVVAFDITAMFLLAIMFVFSGIVVTESVDGYGESTFGFFWALLAYHLIDGLILALGLKFNKNFSEDSNSINSHNKMVVNLIALAAFCSFPIAVILIIACRGEVSRFDVLVYSLIVLIFSSIRFYIDLKIHIRHYFLFNEERISIDLWGINSGIAALRTRNDP